MSNVSQDAIIGIDVSRDWLEPSQPSLETLRRPPACRWKTAQSRCHSRRKKACHHRERAVQIPPELELSHFLKIQLLVRSSVRFCEDIVWRSSLPSINQQYTSSFGDQHLSLLATNDSATNRPGTSKSAEILREKATLGEQQ